MSVPQQSPALPWGSGQQAAQVKQEPSVVADDVHAVSIDQLGLTIGDRIEVGCADLLAWLAQHAASESFSAEGMRLLQVKWQVQPDEGDPIERVSAACCSLLPGCACCPLCCCNR